MRAKNFTIHQCRIVFVDMSDMRFDKVFSLFDDPEIYDTTR